MIRARLVVGICLALAFLQPATPGQADNSLMPMADASARAAWGKQIRAEHTCDVRHIERRTRAAPFPTTLPCEYLDIVTYADGTLEWDGADPIAEMLAVVVEGPVMSSDDRPACDDSTRGDVVAFSFADGKKALELSYFPLEGLLQVYDGKERIGFYDLDVRNAELLALLAGTMASDPRLAKIVACPGRIDALGVVAAGPEACPPYAVEELPEAAEKVKPKYPKESRERNEEGTVTVQALVNGEGKVVRTRIARSVGAFDAYAVRAVEQWRFKPARSKNKPVAVWVAVPVKFSLD